MLVKCHFVTWARHCWYIPLNLQFYMVFEKIPQLLIAVSLFRHSSLPFFFFSFFWDKSSRAKICKCFCSQQLKFLLLRLQGWCIQDPEKTVNKI